MLKEKLDNDLIEALKSKDSLKVSTLRLLKSALRNAEIAKQKELSAEEIIGTIKKQAKQRKDSIEEFRKGNRPDLAEKEAGELKILQAYLPEELSPEELLDIVRRGIAETGVESLREMGKIMKAVMAEVKGRADGKAISALVKEELSKKEQNSGC